MGKSYNAAYVCKNCGETKIIAIPFGNPIPYTTDYSEFYNGNSSQYYIESPICEYCGCNDWHDGKVYKE